MGRLSKPFFFLCLSLLCFHFVSSLNHYEKLGVSKNANSKEIKSAFRALALKTHPDKNPSAEAAQEFSEISLAYETLSDTRKRQIYDAELNEQEMGHRFHQRRQRGSGHSGRHFIFKQNGRTYVFTEEEYYAQQNPFGNRQQYYQPETMFDSGLMLAILKNLFIFGVIWVLLRAGMEGEGSSDDSNQSSSRRPPSPTPPSRNKRHGSKYSEFSTNEDGENDEAYSSYQNNSGDKPRQETGSGINDSRKKDSDTAVTSFKRSERVRNHAPHLNYFEVRYLKQRGRRHVIFIPRNVENVLEWQTYEQIALNFIHDRLSFYWLSEKHEKKWRDFIEHEFQSYNDGGVSPLVIVFGGASGAKRTCFKCSESDLPITPMGSLKDRISRWLEGIVEGTEELSYTDCDLPVDDDE